MDFTFAHAFSMMALKTPFFLSLFAFEIVINDRRWCGICEFEIWWAKWSLSKELYLLRTKSEMGLTCVLFFCTPRMTVYFAFVSVHNGIVSDGPSSECMLGKLYYIVFSWHVEFSPCRWKKIEYIVRNSFDEGCSAAVNETNQFFNYGSRWSRIDIYFF